MGSGSGGRDGVVRVEVETQEFMRWAREYGRVMGRSMGEVLEEQMGRVTLAAAAFTPPFPRGNAGAQVWVRTPKGRQTIRWRDHKEAGKAAIVRDLLGTPGRQEGIFEQRAREWFERMFEAMELMEPGEMGIELTRFERAQRVATLRESLPLGWEQSAVRGEFKRFMEPDGRNMASHHRRYRSKRTGRTARKSRRAAVIGRAGVTDVMVVTPEAVNRYLRELQKRVGILKAGWYRAARALRLPGRWPAWLAKAPVRAGGFGVKRLRGARKFVTASNLVRYAGRQNAQVGIVRQALRFAGRNLRKQVEAAARRARRDAARAVKRAVRRAVR